MSRIDEYFFKSITAGEEASSFLLNCAIFLAEFGSWLSITLIFVLAVRRPQHISYLLILLLMAGLISMLSKALSEWLNFPRPFALGLSPSHIFHADRGGLPSTHATVMGWVALGLATRCGLRDLAAWIALLALLTCWSRVYVGLHFPLDILAGLALSGLCLLPYTLAYRSASRTLLALGKRASSRL